MTTYFTNNPIGSVDVKDLYDNAQNFDVAINGEDTTWVDRLGVTRKSWALIEESVDTVVDSANAMIASLGYQVPVEYAAGIELTAASQTVEYNGQTYAPIQSELPFTTSGVFETDKFRLIQGVSGADLASSFGSSMVGYSQGSTGSVPRTAQDKMRDLVTPKDFGAVADGVSDDHASIQASLVSGAKVVDGGGLTYKVNSTLDIPSGVTLKNADIDFSGGPIGTSCFTANGVYGEFVSFNQPLDRYTLRLTPANSQSYSAGDLVRIKSGDVFDPGSTDSLCGEINAVRSVDYVTGFVTLLYPMQTLYTELPRQVAKITPVKNVVIDGVNIQGASVEQNGQKGIWVTCGDEIQVVGCSFSRMDDRGVGLQDCINSTVTKSVFRPSRPSSTGYGVSFIDATQDCSAIGNHFYDVRHSLSTNNTTDPGGIPRRIIFDANTIFCSTYALSGSMGGGDAIDTHTAAEQITITNNTVIGSTGSGINAENPSVIISGNTLVDCLGSGILFHNESAIQGDAIITNNHIENCGSQGIYMFQGARGPAAILRTGVISNNIVIAPGSNGIQVGSPATSQYCTGITISGNSVLNSSGHGLYVENLRDSTITGNTIRGSALNGIRLLDCLGVPVSSNSVAQQSDSIQHGILVLATTAGSTTRVIISNNYSSTVSGTMTSDGIRLDNTVTYSGILGNIVRGTNGLTVGTGAGHVEANNIT